MDVFVIVYKTKDDEEEKEIFTIDVDNAVTYSAAIEVKEEFETYEQVEKFIEASIKLKFNIKKIHLVDYTEIETID